MTGGTLVVSRANLLFPLFKRLLENEAGFAHLSFTTAEKDALNTAIVKHNPRLLMIDSDFYYGATPYMIGEIHLSFPELEIAVISLTDYPSSLSAWFIWEGAKSFISLWDGDEEFYHGLMLVREGKQYISPKVQHLIDIQPEWPDTHNKLTKRLKECLIMLCCGFVPAHIGAVMHITRKTVNNHLKTLYNIFHVNNREEMVAVAWTIDLVTKKDIRFYDRKRECKRFPEWVAIKKNAEKKANIWEMGDGDWKKGYEYS
jgi:DNA-binding NarL/FixJ family response regulator